MSHNSSAFIQFPGGGRAFIDGLTQDHVCNDKGDVEYQTASGKMIYWHTQRKWAHLTAKSRRPLLYAYYQSIDDPICMETSTCSVCKEVFLFVQEAKQAQMKQG